MQEPTNRTDDQVDVRPWFRYGMVWMVILLPLIVVIASLITVVIAHSNAPVLVDRSPGTAVERADSQGRP